MLWNVPVNAFIMGKSHLVTLEKWFICDWFLIQIPKLEHIYVIGWATQCAVKQASLFKYWIIILSTKSSE